MAVDLASIQARALTVPSTTTTVPGTPTTTAPPTTTTSILPAPSDPCP